MRCCNPVVMCPSTLQPVWRLQDLRVADVERHTRRRTTWLAIATSAREDSTSAAQSAANCSTAVTNTGNMWQQGTAGKHGRGVLICLDFLYQNNNSSNNDDNRRGRENKYVGTCFFKGGGDELSSLAPPPPPPVLKSVMTLKAARCSRARAVLTCKSWPCETACEVSFIDPLKCLETTFQYPQRKENVPKVNK